MQIFVVFSLLVCLY